MGIGNYKLTNILFMQTDSGGNISNWEEILSVNVKESSIEHVSNSGWLLR
jgi:hypothetical protein